MLKCSPKWFKSELTLFSVANIAFIMLLLEKSLLTLTKLG